LQQQHPASVCEDLLHFNDQRPRAACCPERSHELTQRVGMQAFAATYVQRAQLRTCDVLG
jgi:hypothetical protein